MSWNNAHEALRKLENAKLPHWENYYGFYNSWLGGYFREPWAALLPLDDHGFHRGDAVFEAGRIYHRAFFDLGSHLKRLQTSARAIGMELPKSLDEIEAICVKLAQLCNVDHGALRLYVSRGPGSFSPSPSDVIGHQIYAAITKLKPPSDTAYESGVRAMFSTIPAKEPFWSQIKSCNYLQNVLMKQECNKKGVDYAICLNEQEELCEGSTENMMIITQDLHLIVPKFDYTLSGTTVMQVMKIAEASGKVKSVSFGNLHREDLKRAREAALVGTTLAVLPLTEIEGTKIGSGKAGEICRWLNGELLSKMRDDETLRTKF